MKKHIFSLLFACAAVYSSATFAAAPVSITSQTDGVVASPNAEIPMFDGSTPYKGKISDQVWYNVKAKAGKTTGAICDGTSHPASEFYASLALLQADWSNGASLTDEIDGIVIQKYASLGYNIYIPDGTCMVNTAISFSSKIFNIKSHPNAIIKGTGSTVNTYFISCASCSVGLENVTFDGENVYEEPFGFSNPVNIKISNMNISDIGSVTDFNTAVVSGLVFTGTMTGHINIDDMTVSDIHAMPNGTFGDSAGTCRAIYIAPSSNQSPKIKITNFYMDEAGSDCEELDPINQNVSVIKPGFLIIDGFELAYTGDSRRCIKIHTGDTYLSRLNIYKSASFVTAPSAAGSTDVGEKNQICIDFASSGQGSINLSDSVIDWSGFTTGYAGTAGCTDCYIRAENVKFIGGQYQVDRYDPESEVTGTATAGGASTITLDPLRSSTKNSNYNGATVEITGGTGIGQTGTVVSYVGATHVATMTAPWSTEPDSTSEYHIYKAVTASPYGMITGTADVGSGCNNCIFKGGYVGVQLRGYQSYLTNSIIDDPVLYGWQIQPSSSTRTGIRVENTTVITRTGGRLSTGTRINSIQNAADFSVKNNRLVQAGNTAHVGFFIDLLSATDGEFFGNTTPATYDGGTMTQVRKLAASPAKVVANNYSLESILESNITAVGNVGTGTDNLQTFSVPAYTLQSVTQGIEIEFSGEYANNVNAKAFVYDIGGTDVISLTLPTSQAGIFEGKIKLMRTGSNAQYYKYAGTYTGASGVITPFSGTGTLTKTDTSAITVKGKGTATTNNDVVQSLHFVKRLN